MPAVTPEWWQGRNDLSHEVIWIDHNPQAGREIMDLHPFLVLSTAPFHASVGLVVGCTMTSAQGARSHPMGSLSNNRLELVREIVGQILGFVV